MNKKREVKAICLINSINGLCEKFRLISIPRARSLAHFTQVCNVRFDLILQKQIHIHTENVFERCECQLAAIFEWIQIGLNFEFNKSLLICQKERMIIFVRHDLCTHTHRFVLRKGRPGERKKYVGFDSAYATIKSFNKFQSGEQIFKQRSICTLVAIVWNF